MPGEIVVTDDMITCSACGNRCVFNRQKPWKSDVIVNCPDPSAHGEFEEAIRTAKSLAETDGTEIIEEPQEDLDFGLQTFGGTDSQRHRVQHRR